MLICVILCSATACMASNPSAYIPQRSPEPASAPTAKLHHQPSALEPGHRQWSRRLTPEHQVLLLDVGLRHGLEFAGVYLIVGNLPVACKHTGESARTRLSRLPRTAVGSWTILGQRGREADDHCHSFPQTRQYLNELLRPTSHFVHQCNRAMMCNITQVTSPSPESSFVTRQRQGSHAQWAFADPGLSDK